MNNKKEVHISYDVNNILFILYTWLMKNVHGEFFKSLIILNIYIICVINSLSIYAILWNIFQIPTKQIYD